MGTRNSCEAFLRLGFVSSIREHPGEKVHQQAYQDWLQDVAGYTLMGAKRIVAKLVREATDEWCCARVGEWLKTDTLQSRRVRHAVLNTAGVQHPEIATVKVVVGAEGPQYKTAEAYRIMWNISAETALVTLPGTVPNPTQIVLNEWVEIGHRWLMQLCERWNIQIIGLAAPGGPYA